MTVGEVKIRDGVAFQTALDSQGNEVSLRSQDRHVYHYRGTGTAQDNIEVAKIVSALNGAGGGILELHGDVEITGTQAFTVPVELRGAPGARVIMESANGLLQFGDVSKPFDASTIYNIAPTSAKQSTFTVTNANGQRDLRQGDYVAIMADNEYTDVGRDGTAEMRPMEIRRIVKPTRAAGVYSTTEFEIDGFVWDPLTTNPRVVLLNSLKDVVIRNLVFATRYTDSEAHPVAQATIRLGTCVGARIVDCVFDSPSPGEISTRYCHDLQIHGCSFREKVDPDESHAASGEGYGITLDACTEVDIAHCRFEFMRHAVTVGSGFALNGNQYGIVRRATVRDNLCFVGLSTRANDTKRGEAVFDTHAGSSEMIFEENTFEVHNLGFAGYCIQTRGRDSIIRNNKFFAGNTGSNAQQVLIWGPGCRLENNYFKNAWFGVRVQDIGTTLATTDGLVATGNAFENMLAYGLSLEFGSNHVIEQNEFGTVGTACVRIQAGTDHQFRENYMPYTGSNTSVRLDGVDRTAIADTDGFVSNSTPNYPSGRLGFDRTSLEGRFLDSKWWDSNTNAPRLVKVIAGNSLDIGTDLYAPVARAGTVLDDTTDTEMEGLLIGLDGDDVVLYPVGSQIQLPDGRLPGSGSYVPGTNDRLFWDASLIGQDTEPGAYVFTKPGDSGIEAVLKVLDQHGTNPGGQFVCEVLDPAPGAGGGGGGIEEAPIDGTPYVRQDAGWVSQSASVIARKDNADSLVFNANLAVDFDTGSYDNKLVTLTDNLTGLTFSATRAGIYCFAVAQDATAGHSITWPGNVRWQGMSPQPNQNPSTISVFQFFYDGTQFAGLA